MEADSILAVGFENDVKNILGSFSARRPQIISLSTTLPADLVKMTDNDMQAPKRILIESNVNVAIIDSLRHTVKYVASEEDKLAAIYDLFQPGGLVLAIVVCSGERLVSTVLYDLKSRGVRATALGNDMDPEEMDRSTKDFLSGTCSLLIVPEQFACNTNLHKLGNVARPSVVINVSCPSTHSMPIRLRIGFGSQYDLPVSIEAYGRRIDPRSQNSHKSLIINLVLEQEGDRLREIEEF